MPIEKELIIDSLSDGQGFLDLGGCELTNEDIIWIVQFLKDNAYVVKSINLCANDITDQSIVTICSIDGLTTIDLRENKITEMGMAILASIPLIKLNISGNPIGDSGIIMLSKNKTILELEATGCNISSEGALAVLQNSTIKSLNLSENNISGYGLKNIVTNNILEKLKLSYAHIDALGAQYLGENHSLRVLDLTANYIGDIGSLALSKHQTLEELDVTQNNISDEGVKEFIHNKTLKSLILLDNKVTNGGLLDLLKKSFLVFINLHGNPINEDSFLLEMKNSCFYTSSDRVFTRDQEYVEKLQKGTIKPVVFTPLSVTQYHEKRKVEAFDMDIMNNIEFLQFFFRTADPQIKEQVGVIFATSYEQFKKQKTQQESTRPSPN